MALISSRWLDHLQVFVNPLLPRGCFGCEKLLVPGEQKLCSFCRHELPLTNFSFGTENNMDKALYGLFRFEKASALFYYHKTGALKHCLQYLKYRKQEQISLFFGRWHAQLLRNDPDIPPLDCIVPVPIHPKKKRLRGYNQLSGYGKALEAVLGVPFVENALIKTANTKTQTKKNRGGRQKASTSLYVVPQPEKLAHKRILLIDDVMTTGATLGQCAKALTDCEGHKLYVLCLAVVA
ncbi:MAG: ComF family protein [Flavobacteriia bacterium]|nr:ComF family protein [Flavobacteriia bacterium]